MVSSGVWQRICSGLLTGLAILATAGHGAAQQPSPEVQAPGLFVSFEGDQPGVAMATVLKLVFGNSDAVRLDSLVTPYTIQSGDSICKILLDHKFPMPCTDEVLSLVDQLNPDSRPSKTGLKVEKSINIPAPPITQYSVQRRVTLDADGKVTDPSVKDMLQNWRFLNVEKRPKSSGDEFIRFDAYRMYISTKSDADSQKILKLIADKKDSTNVKIDLVPADPKPERQHTLPPTDVTGWVQECSNGYVFSAAAGALKYRDLVTVDADALAQVDSGLKPAAVTVHIVDGPLNDLPDLTQAPPPGTPCKFVKFDVPRHHATHMAGIMAGKNTGFAGLASNAKIERFDWLKPDGDKSVRASLTRSIDLSQKMSNTESQSPIHIYLMATTYDPQIPPGYDRFYDPVASAMRDTSNFFVLSAGQTSDQDASPTPVPLSKDQRMWPQNLGDLQGVLVVTACNPCTGSPKILSSANYSAEGAGAVHVAAPSGADIVGWVSRQEVSAAGGTSQAAAYVAGLASAMIGTYKDGYRTGLNVKRRLQVTSQPTPWNEDDIKKLTAGIVDPAVAMLDPTKHWLKKNGSWTAVKIKSLAGSFNQIQAMGAFSMQTIPAPTLLRIVRTRDAPAGQCQNDQCRWDIYQDVVPEGGAKKTGTIKRYAGMRMPTGVPIALCDSSLQWADIQDLIIASDQVKDDECKP